MLNTFRKLIGLPEKKKVQKAAASTDKQQNFRDLLYKLQRYEIRVRKAINTRMHGDFQSVFKGSGLEFDDVRSYQYGDDVRAIDWNVSAKGHGTFVKTFKEEKEQNVFFILDVSGSQYIGKENSQKIDIGKEICGVLSLAAIKENSSVGLLCFSNVREKYIKPKKGRKHALNIVGSLFSIDPRSLKTDLEKAMSLTMNIVKRKSILVIISDFVAEGYESRLKALSRRHDVIVIHLADPRETFLPGLGIVPLDEKESGKTFWVNSNSASFRENYIGSIQKRKENLMQICRLNKADYLFIDTSEDYVRKLVDLFNIRNRVRK